MDVLQLEGRYADEHGDEPIRWTIGPSSRPGWERRYEITTVIRDRRASGADFDGLEPDEPTDRLSVNQAGELDDCILEVVVPSTLGDDPEARLLLHMELRRSHDAPLTTARMLSRRGGVEHTEEERFEVVLGRLNGMLGHAAWRCCLTCGLSDYNPGGNSMMGMRCHRDTKESYRNSRGKWEYWAIPVTEEVPEFYACPAWETRRASTRYRG